MAKQKDVPKLDVTFSVEVRRWNKAKEKSEFVDEYYRVVLPHPHFLSSVIGRYFEVGHSVPAHYRVFIGEVRRMASKSSVTPDRWRKVCSTFRNNPNNSNNVHTMMIACKALQNPEKLVMTKAQVVDMEVVATVVGACAKCQFENSLIKDELPSQCAICGCQDIRRETRALWKLQYPNTSLKEVPMRKRDKQGNVIWEFDPQSDVQGIAEEIGNGHPRDLGFVPYKEPELFDMTGMQVDDELMHEVLSNIAAFDTSGFTIPDDDEITFIGEDESLTKLEEATQYLETIEDYEPVENEDDTI